MLKKIISVYVSMNECLKVAIVAICSVAIFITLEHLQHKMIAVDFISDLYGIPYTYEARKGVLNKGLRLVSFARHPDECVEGLEYATIVATNPDNPDLFIVPGWTSREEIKKRINEVCEQ